jgi:hypothetical protein
MLEHRRRCPRCEELVVVPKLEGRVKKEGFSCAACGANLTLSSNLVLTSVVSLALSSVCCFFFGVRGYISLAFIAASSLPLSFFVDGALVALVPPPQNFAKIATPVDGLHGKVAGI